jgi:transposase
MKLSNCFDKLSGSFDFLPHIKTEKNGRMRTRLTALQNLKEGRSVQDISQTLKIARSRIPVWAKRFLESGIDGLREQPGRGCKPKITAEQKKILANYVEERSSSNKGGRIFGQDIVTFISDNFGYKYTTSSAYNIMHELKFSWITSRSVHPKCDKDAQAEFKKNLA